MTAPPDILESAEDGSKGGRVLWGGIYRGLVSDTGRTNIPHHFNVMVYGVVFHWVSVMVEGAEEQGQCGQ